MLLYYNSPFPVAELTEQADAARVQASLLADDFGALFDSEQTKWCDYFDGRVSEPPSSTCDLVVQLGYETSGMLCSRHTVNSCGHHFVDI